MGGKLELRRKTVITRAYLPVVSKEKSGGELLTIRKMGISKEEEHCNLLKRVIFETLKGFQVIG